MDWKDTLSNLKATLGESPAVDNPGETPETQEDSRPKSVLHVLIDKKGRNGKTATIIECFQEEPSVVEKVAKILKQKLGVGGSVRNGEILIQGERKDKVKEILNSLGYKTKG